MLVGIDRSHKRCCIKPDTKLGQHPEAFAREGSSRGYEEWVVRGDIRWVRGSARRSSRREVGPFRLGPFPSLVLRPNLARFVIEDTCQIGDCARMSDTLGQLGQQLRRLAERRLL